MIYIGIGSNLGNRINNIERAKYLLSTSGINITKSSSYYETLSWPDNSKPKFMNIVIQSNTKFSPKKFLKLFKLIEKKIGRKKSKKNSPRTCDIDIISYYQKVSSGIITIPHERMHERNFVLMPLNEIVPDFIHPKYNKTVSELFKESKDMEKVVEYAV